MASDIMAVSSCHHWRGFVRCYNSTLFLYSLLLCNVLSNVLKHSIFPFFSFCFIIYSLFWGEGSGRYLVYLFLSLLFFLLFGGRYTHTQWTEDLESSMICYMDICPQAVSLEREPHCNEQQKSIISFIIIRRS